MNYFAYGVKIHSRPPHYFPTYSVFLSISLSSPCSNSNIDAMTLYIEHIERVRNDEEVDVQVQKRVPEHREWVEAVFDVVIFLIVQKLFCHLCGREVQISIVIVISQN